MYKKYIFIFIFVRAFTSCLGLLLLLPDSIRSACYPLLRRLLFRLLDLAIVIAVFLRLVLVPLDHPYLVVYDRSNFFWISGPSKIKRLHSFFGFFGRNWTFLVRCIWYPRFAAIYIAYSIYVYTDEQTCWNAFLSTRPRRKNQTFRATHPEQSDRDRARVHVRTTRSFLAPPHRPRQLQPTAAVSIRLGVCMRVCIYIYI